MAMIDYGAILRVNGKFINKNADMFMDTSDTGYICERAYYPKHDRYYDINGNYFVYAGDKNFLLVFYKTYFYVIHNEVIIGSFDDGRFASEDMYFDGLPSVCIEHLDKTLYKKPIKSSLGTWKEYVKMNWYNDDGSEMKGDEPISTLEGGWKHRKRFLKNLKRIARINRNGGLYKYRTNRFLVSWKYNGKKYEVILGYGIDNDEETWNRISNDELYGGFTDIEKEIIGKWFD